ncbi:hypothetical protein EBZ39_07180 [bacterium]|nr:hypothetical protein [bacterium]
MSDNKEELKDIDVIEEKDGSATIDLPEGMENPQADDEKDEIEPAVADSQDDSSDNEDYPDDSEAVRAQKRAKRKARREYAKQVHSAERTELQFLRRQVAEMAEKMAVQERKSLASDFARLDKAIDDQRSRINFAKHKIAEATNSQDGELLASAQEMWFESRRNLEMLEAAKKRASQQQESPAQTAADPVLQRHASEWMARNSWYNPADNNPDVKVALTIDQALAEEGWDPRTADYWDELDNRLQRYLPHRYTEQAGGKSAQRRPRNVVTGSGRESMSNSGSGGRNTFTLSPEQVRAMKDAGFWDDPDKRAKMIRRYAQEARQNNGYRS